VSGNVSGERQGSVGVSATPTAAAAAAGNGNTNSNGNGNAGTNPSTFVPSNLRRQQSLDDSDTPVKPARRNSSSTYAYTFKPVAPTGDAADQRLASMDVKQIIAELQRYGVNTAGCVERSDFSELLKQTWKRRDEAAAARAREMEVQHQQEQRARELAREQAERQRQAKELEEKMRRNEMERQRQLEAQRQAEAARREREAAAAAQRQQQAGAAAAGSGSSGGAGAEAKAAQITHEVEQWAKNKPIHTLLNEVNGDRVVKATDGLAAVTKAYRRAMLKIHPDKHMTDPDSHVRATEMFKHVTAAYTLFKKSKGG